MGAVSHFHCSCRSLIMSQTTAPDPDCPVVLRCRFHVSMSRRPILMLSKLKVTLHLIHKIEDLWSGKHKPWSQVTLMPKVSPILKWKLRLIVEKKTNLYPEDKLINRSAFREGKKLSFSPVSISYRVFIDAFYQTQGVSFFSQGADSSVFGFCF